MSDTEADGSARPGAAAGGARSAMRKFHNKHLSMDAIKIPTTEAEKRHVHSIHGEESWQARWLRRIHSPAFQRILMFLLILDVFILFAEMSIDMFFPSCQVVRHHAVSCCEPKEPVRFLSEAAHEDLCVLPSELTTEYEVACDTHLRYPGVHTAHTVLWALTIVILSIFLFELIVLIIVIRPKAFFRHVWYVVDLIIVTVSLAGEITVAVLDQEQLEALVGVLIVFRLWRFVRIGHGIAASTAEITAEYEEHKHHSKPLSEEDKSAAKGLSDDGGHWKGVKVDASATQETSQTSGKASHVAMSRDEKFH